MGAAMAGPPQKSKDFRGSSKRLMRRLAPRKGLVVATFSCAVLGVALGVNGPRLLGEATNLIYAGTRGGSGPGIDFGALARLLRLALVLYAGASLATWLQSSLLNHLVQGTIRQLRRDAQAKLTRLPLAYFDARPLGEVLSRVTNDIDNVATSLQQALGQMVTAMLTVIGVMVMLVWISPLLALVTLATVPLSVIATARIGKRAQGRFVAQWKHVGTLNGQVEEAFTGHSLVRVLGRAAEVQARFEATNRELFLASQRAQFLSSLMMPVVMFVGNLTYVLIAVVGGLRVAAGAMRLGGVQAFIQYSRQFTQQLGQLASLSNVLQSGVASAERVFELLDAPEESADAAIRVAAPRVGRVVFEHVKFRYQPDVPLIEDLSLVVEPGQTIAIVGPTGAGKTTLVNLLMRFYELDGGRILLDGVDIATQPRGWVRDQIGMVLQDTWLFAGSIRENIAYGDPAASADALLEAAKSTYVDRFARALPAGYDTPVTDDADNLSAGEQQLITIARAALASPAILVLDEATSSVDTRTEVLVQQAMAALREHRTSFVIAHRLSTIRDADTILVMAKGTIVEQGSHDQLVAAKGLYSTLYEAQFAGSAAP